jgi:hypothetical protein
VISYLPIAKALTLTLRLGVFASSSLPVDEPIVKLPPGMAIISGQSGQSRNGVVVCATAAEATANMQRRAASLVEFMDK